jgi:hypothetical protein
MAWQRTLRAGAVLFVVATTPACGHDRTAEAPQSHSGCRWQRLATPNAPGNHVSRLLAVSATGPRSAWAVGDFSSGHEGGATGPIVERWDGRRWALVRGALPPGAESGDVLALSRREVWIVGSAWQGNHAFVAHWDGARWTAAHWDGARWTSAYWDGARWGGSTWDSDASLD